MRRIGLGLILIAAVACSNNPSAAPQKVVQSGATDPPPEVVSATPEFPVTSTTEPVPEPEPEPVPEPTVPTTIPEPATTTTHTHATYPTTVTSAPTLAPSRPRSTSSELASIRACESGSDYSTNTGNGYYGAYQFSLSTWQSVGGSGYPHLASPAEQDMRAQIMINQGRRGEWPNC